VVSPPVSRIAISLTSSSRTYNSLLTPSLAQFSAPNPPFQEGGLALPSSNGPASLHPFWLWSLLGCPISPSVPSAFTGPASTSLSLSKTAVAPAARTTRPLPVFSSATLISPFPPPLAAKMASTWESPFSLSPCVSSTENFCVPPSPHLRMSPHPCPPPPPPLFLTLPLLTHFLPPPGLVRLISLTLYPLNTPWWFPFRRPPLPLAPPLFPFLPPFPSRLATL